MDIKLSIDYYEAQRRALIRAVFRKVRDFIKHLPEPIEDGGLSLETIKKMSEKSMSLDSSEVGLFYDLLKKEIRKMKREDKEMADGVFKPDSEMDPGTEACLRTARALANEAMEDSIKDPFRIASLYDTRALMMSRDYKKRFVAEYYQTKIRYEKLKAFNNRIEAAKQANGSCYIEWATAKAEGKKKVEMPEHDCPDDLLRAQQHTMGDYLHLLEVRAVIEGIDLEAYK